jgi:hypothetical protein
MVPTYAQGVYICKNLIAMRFILFLVLVCTSSSLLAQHKTSSSSDKGYNTYHFNSYSLKFPKSWKISNSNDSNATFTALGKKAGMLDTIRVTFEEETFTAEDSINLTDYMYSHIIDIRNVARDFTLSVRQISKSTTGEYGEILGYYTEDYAKQIAHIAVKLNDDKTRGFVLTVGCTPNVFNRHSSEIKHLLSTFLP